MVSDKHKYDYISIAKTGTRSIYEILRTKYGGKIAGDHRRDVQNKYKKYFIFTTIRNPYDRTCSAYQQCFAKKDQYGYRKQLKIHQKEITLVNFLKAVKNKWGNCYRVTTFPQTYWTEANKIDMFLRTENIEEDFLKLPFVEDIGKFPQKNMRKDKHDPVPSSEEILTVESIAMINDFYAKDFEKLGFKKVRTLKQFKRKYR